MLEPLREGTIDEFEVFLSEVLGESQNDPQVAEARAFYMSSLVRYSPPEIVLRFPQGRGLHSSSGSETTIGYITIGSDGGGISRKPANFYLNWRAFFHIWPDVAIATWAADGPLRGVVVALYIWNKVWNSVAVEVPVEAAVVLEALWRQPGGRRKFTRADVDVIFRRHSTSPGQVALTSEAVDDALSWLDQWSCIRLKNDQVWLRESVQREV